MPNVLAVAALDPEFNLSYILIDLAGLAETCPGPFTALLPTNAAWQSLDPTFFAFLLQPENAEALKDIILYHILPGLYPSAQLVPGPVDTLLPGAVVTVSINPIMFNNAGVERLDITACNGLIDGIDAVLLPFLARKSAIARDRSIRSFAS